MLNNDFFTQFLKISNFLTLFALLLLVGSLYFMKLLKQRRFSFSNRMLIGLLIGIILGVAVDLLGSSQVVYKEYAQVEIQAWYGLLGNGFLKLIQLLVVPVVFLSIIKVVTDVKGDTIRKLTGRTFTLLLGTTAISAFVGIVVVKLFRLTSSSFAEAISADKAEYISNIASQSFPEFFLNLIPNNIFSVFSTNSSVVSVVIIAALFASAIRFLKSKKPEQIESFISLLDSLRTIVNSVLTNIIKLMPYGVIALISNTIISNGISSIMGMIQFIVALYAGVFIMLIIYLFILISLGLNPRIFFKKSFDTLLFAFSSRSSVGTLPYTLKTLKQDLGVADQTADFVATLGTTIGMNGCAGVFPSMLAVLVASASGINVNFTFVVLIVLVVTIGSIGIAGVPGTATVAATVTLNGLGLGSAMSSIGAVFGIDPIIDMGRTMLNVAGAMVSAIVVDKWSGTFNEKLYASKLDKNQDSID